MKPSYKGKCAWITGGGSGLGKAMAMELHGSGVSCTLLYQGYMDTVFAQLDNYGQLDPKKKRVTNRFMWSAERLAKTCVRAIHKRRREFVFTGLGIILLHFMLTRFRTPGSETLDAS